MKSLKIVLFSILFSISASISEDRGSLKVEWKNFLPVIADVESWGNGCATSYWDEAKTMICARGKYQITRLCYEDFKRRHWPKYEWLRIEMLYNDDIGAMISLDTLQNLATRFGDQNIWLVLSGYHKGPEWVLSNGVHWEYVNKCITNKLCPDFCRIVK